ncbi:MAG: thiamine pyrophosphate-binding protein [Syntrophorhabdaceae bacterium]|nr:thiamine pyrophosphate-binding protein [Syntrophorhabdaceae bacterium]MDD4195548.1 thiamine pyrophosphate-binding protein [Syntrophorhabdaceae bacterium]
MQGKQVIRTFFRENDVSHIFQLPGLHTLPLSAELFWDETIKSITTRHEMNCAFMADGYARASGKPAFLLVTPGPGLGNVVSGCMEAYSDDVPIFILHVDTDRKDIGKGILHELEYPENIFRYITRDVFRITKPAQLRHTLDSALDRCTQGRTGPVLVSVPFSFLDREIPATHSPSSEPRSPAPTSYRALDKFLDDCRGILEHKLKPVLIGGKGLMTPRAGDTIEEICAQGVPYLTSTGGKGTIDERAIFSFGNIITKGVARDILDSADLVIAAGARLRDADVKKRGVKIRDLIHIDIDGRWINKNFPASAHFEGNVELALEGLSAIMRDLVFDWDLASLKEKKTAERKALQSVPGHAITNLIRNAVPPNTVFVCDLNLPSYWAEYYLPVYFQRSFLMPRGISPTFYSLSAAIGVKLARPDAPCLALCGDGGVLPQTAELATVVKYKVPVVIFVDNNNSYAILEDATHSRYQISGSMCLDNPDFVKLAHSYGIKAEATDSIDGLRKIFRRHISWNEPFLIEFRNTILSPPWA